LIHNLVRLRLFRSPCLDFLKALNFYKNIFVNDRKILLRIIQLQSEPIRKVKMHQVLRPHDYQRRQCLLYELADLILFLYSLNLQLLDQKYVLQQ